MGNNLPLSPTKRDLLLSTQNGKLIFYHFLPNLKVKGSKIKSITCPFYDDKKASLSIYEKDGRWCFYDHGNTEFKGDCFEFARLWYEHKEGLKLSFYEIIYKLYIDLKLFHKTSNDIIELPLSVYKEAEQKNIPTISFKLDEIEFTSIHTDYFSQYGITPDILKMNNVVAIKSYQYFDIDSNSWKTFTCYNTTFAFKGKNYAKIYQPSPKTFIWRGNKPLNYVFGKDLLPEYGNGEKVILAAGEKDALTLMSLGYYAISLNSESSTIPKNLSQEILESQLTLAVLYDIDDTGLKYGDEVAKELNCRNIVLPDLLREKGGKDVSDWIKLGLSEELLRSIIDDDTPLEPILNNPSPAAQPKVFKTMDEYKDGDEIHQIEVKLEKDFLDDVLTGEDLLNLQIDEIPTLVNPIFQKTGIIAFAGSSDTGKSSFLRQLASAVCTGEKEFLGFEINATHKSAIYVSTEDDESSMAVLIRKQNNTKKLDPIKYRNMRYIFDSNDLCTKLNNMLIKQPVDLIIIDAYSDIFTGEINQTNKVRTFLEEYSNLAKKYKCLIIFLHHTNKKSEEKEPSKGNLLGSQGFEAKMRMVIELRKDPECENLRHICIVKGNYLSSEYKTASFELEFSEDMLFESTGNRVPFSELKKSIEKGTEDSGNFESIKEMKNQGLSFRQIEEKTGISKSKVGRMLKK